MAFKRSNTMSVSERRTMDSLLEMISTSNNEGLQDQADMYKLRQTFGRDSMESERSQFAGSSTESGNAEYARRGQEMRNVGSHRSTVPNVRELNSTPLSDLNAERSKTQSAFEKANYSR